MTRMYEIMNYVTYYWKALALTFRNDFMDFNFFCKKVGRRSFAKQ